MGKSESLCAKLGNGFPMARGIDEEIERYDIDMHYILKKTVDELYFERKHRSEMNNLLGVDRVDFDWSNQKRNQLFHFNRIGPTAGIFIRNWRWYKLLKHMAMAARNMNSRYFIESNSYKTKKIFKITTSWEAIILITMQIFNWYSDQKYAI